MSRTRKAKRRSKRISRQAEQQKTHPHPRFGDIPLVARETTLASGQPYTWFDYDPDYRPRLPRGAVRGDVRQQKYCRMCFVPRYFYEDETKSCVDCGDRFVFSASEQKFWYDTLQFNFEVLAIRCKDCRREVRAIKGLHRQLGDCLRKLAANGRDEDALLALAEATVSLRERTGQGKIDRAIAACRRLARLRPSNAEALFWQARCQELAERPEVARVLFSEFLALPTASRNKKQWRYAKQKTA